MHASHVALTLVRKPLLAASLLAPCVVMAADNGFYVGASRAEVSPDYDWSFAQFEHGPEDDGTGFKVIAGIRPLDWLAIETNYVDLGETEVPLLVACAALVGIECPSRASFEATAISVSAVALKSFPLLDVFARAGVSRWQSERDVSFAPTQKDDGTDPSYGAGIQARLGSFALRVEYERFELSDDSADLLSFGFTYTFL